MQIRRFGQGTQAAIPRQRVGETLMACSGQGTEVRGRCAAGTGILATARAHRRQAASQ
jgi:hypothetical protein